MNPERSAATQTYKKKHKNINRNNCHCPSPGNNKKNYIIFFSVSKFKNFQSQVCMLPCIQASAQTRSFYNTLGSAHYIEYSGRYLP